MRPEQLVEWLSMLRDIRTNFKNMQITYSVYTMDSLINYLSCELEKNDISARVKKQQEEALRDAEKVIMASRLAIKAS